MMAAAVLLVCSPPGMPPSGGSAAGGQKLGSSALAASLPALVAMGLLLGGIELIAQELEVAGSLRTHA